MATFQFLIGFTDYADHFVYVFAQLLVWFIPLYRLEQSFYCFNLQTYHLLT